MLLESRLTESATAKKHWWLVAKPKLVFLRYYVGTLLFCAVAIAGCENLPKQAADAQSESKAASQGSTPVEVEIAQIGKLEASLEYTGTTAPVQEVSLRSQVEGRVLKLNVDVGDAVKQGQILTQLDDTILRTTLNQEQAELASFKAEVARAQNQVSNAKAATEQARLELQQAQSDSRRQEKLVAEGAVALQQAEQARTTARTAAQELRAAQEQVNTEQQAVAAAQNQVKAQQATVAQAQEQLSYARLTSPTTGVVTQRLTEEGNLLQPNTEVLRIGDFRRVQVNVEVSELELAKIQQGQSVTVRLDAFGNQTFKGQVSRISPAADQTARLVPIEVIIPNTNGKIGSGLLARVSFENANQRVVVPESAVLAEGTGGTGGTGGDSLIRLEKFGGTETDTANFSQNQKSKIQNSSGTIFVVGKEGTTPTVAARKVLLGLRANGKVEIVSGLKRGEQFVAKSGKPLKDGENVRLSILSETAQGGQQ